MHNCRAIASNLNSTVANAVTDLSRRACDTSNPGANAS